MFALFIVLALLAAPLKWGEIKGVEGGAGGGGSSWWPGWGGGEGEAKQQERRRTCVMDIGNPLDINQEFVPAGVTFTNAAGHSGSCSGIDLLFMQHNTSTSSIASPFLRFAPVTSTYSLGGSTLIPKGFYGLWIASVVTAQDSATLSHALSIMSSYVTILNGSYAYNSGTTGCPTAAVPTFQQINCAVVSSQSYNSYCTNACYLPECVLVESYCDISTMLSLAAGEYTAKIVSDLGFGFGDSQLFMGGVTVTPDNSTLTSVEFQSGCTSPQIMTACVDPPTRSNSHSQSNSHSHSHSHSHSNSHSHSDSHHSHSHSHSRSESDSHSHSDSHSASHHSESQSQSHDVPAGCVPFLNNFDNDNIQFLLKKQRDPYTGLRCNASSIFYHRTGAYGEAVQLLGSYNITGPGPTGTNISLFGNPFIPTSGAAVLAQVYAGYASTPDPTAFYGLQIEYAPGSPDSCPTRQPPVNCILLNANAGAPCDAVCTGFSECYAFYYICNLPALSPGNYTLGFNVVYEHGGSPPARSNPALGDLFYYNTNTMEVTSQLAVEQGCTYATLESVCPFETATRSASLSPSDSRSHSDSHSESHHSRSPHHTESRSQSQSESISAEWQCSLQAWSSGPQTLQFQSKHTAGTDCITAGGPGGSNTSVPGFRDYGTGATFSGNINTLNFGGGVSFWGTEYVSWTDSVTVVVGLVYNNQSGAVSYPLHLAATVDPTAETPAHDACYSGLYGVTCNLIGLLGLPPGVIPVDGMVCGVPLSSSGFAEYICELGSITNATATFSFSFGNATDFFVVMQAVVPPYNTTPTATHAIDPFMITLANCPVTDNGPCVSPNSRSPSHHSHSQMQSESQSHSTSHRSHSTSPAPYCTLEAWNSAHHPILLQSAADHESECVIMQGPTNNVTLPGFYGTNGSAFVSGPLSWDNVTDYMTAWGSAFPSWTPSVAFTIIVVYNNQSGAIHYPYVGFTLQDFVRGTCPGEVSPLACTYEETLYSYPGLIDFGGSACGVPVATLNAAVYNCPVPDVGFNGTLSFGVDFGNATEFYVITRITVPFHAPDGPQNHVIDPFIATARDCPAEELLECGPHEFTPSFSHSESSHPSPSASASTAAGCEPVVWDSGPNVIDLLTTTTPDSQCEKSSDSGSQPLPGFGGTANNYASATGPYAYSSLQTIWGTQFSNAINEVFINVEVYYDAQNLAVAPPTVSLSFDHLRNGYCSDSLLFDSCTFNANTTHTSLIEYGGYACGIPTAGLMLATYSCVVFAPVGNNLTVLVSFGLGVDTTYFVSMTGVGTVFSPFPTNIYTLINPIPDAQTGCAPAIVGPCVPEPATQSASTSAVPEPSPSASASISPTIEPEEPCTNATGPVVYLTGPLIVDTGGIVNDFDFWDEDNTTSGSTPPYDGPTPSKRRRSWEPEVNFQTGPLPFDNTTSAFLDKLWSPAYIGSITQAAPYRYGPGYDPYTEGMRMSQYYNCGVHQRVLECSGNVQVWLRPQPSGYVLHPSSGGSHHTARRVERAVPFRAFSCIVLTANMPGAVIPLTSGVAISDVSMNSTWQKLVNISFVIDAEGPDFAFDLSTQVFGFEIARPQNSPADGLYYRCDMGEELTGAYEPLFAGTYRCQSSGLNITVNTTWDTSSYVAPPAPPATASESASASQMQSPSQSQMQSGSESPHLPGKRRAPAETASPSAFNFAENDAYEERNMHFFATPTCPSGALCPSNGWFFSTPYAVAADYVGPAYAFPAVQPATAPGSSAPFAVNFTYVATREVLTQLQDIHPPHASCPIRHTSMEVVYYMQLDLFHQVSDPRVFYPTFVWSTEDGCYEFRCGNYYTDPITPNYYYFKASVMEGMELALNNWNASSVPHTHVKVGFDIGGCINSASDHFHAVVPGITNAQYCSIEGLLNNTQMQFNLAVAPVTESVFPPPPWPGGDALTGNLAAGLDSSQFPATVLNRLLLHGLAFVVNYTNPVTHVTTGTAELWRPDLTCMQLPLAPPSPCLYCANTTSALYRGTNVEPVSVYGCYDPWFDTNLPTYFWNITSSSGHFEPLVGMQFDTFPPFSSGEYLTFVFLTTSANPLPAAATLAACDQFFGNEETMFNTCTEISIEAICPGYGTTGPGTINWGAYTAYQCTSQTRIVVDDPLALTFFNVFPTDEYLLLYVQGAGTQDSLQLAQSCDVGGGQCECLGCVDTFLDGVLTLGATTATTQGVSYVSGPVIFDDGNASAAVLDNAYPTKRRSPLLNYVTGQPTTLDGRYDSYNMLYPYEGSLPDGSTAQDAGAYINSGCYIYYHIKNCSSSAQVWIQMSSAVVEQMQEDSTDHLGSHPIYATSCFVTAYAKYYSFYNQPLPLTPNVKIINRPISGSGNRFVDGPQQSVFDIQLFVQSPYSFVGQAIANSTGPFSNPGLFGFEIPLTGQEPYEGVYVDCGLYYGVYVASTLEYGISSVTPGTPLFDDVNDQVCASTGSDLLARVSADQGTAEIVGEDVYAPDVHLYFTPSPGCMRVDMCSDWTSTIVTEPLLDYYGPSLVNNVTGEFYMSVPFTGPLLQFVNASVFYDTTLYVTINLGIGNLLIANDYDYSMQGDIFYQINPTSEPDAQCNVPEITHPGKFSNPSVSRAQAAVLGAGRNLHNTNPFFNANGYVDHVQYAFDINPALELLGVTGADLAGYTLAIRFAFPATTPDVVDGSAIFDTVIVNGFGFQIESPTGPGQIYDYDIINTELVQQTAELYYSAGFNCAPAPGCSGGGSESQSHSTSHESESHSQSQSPSPVPRGDCCSRTFPLNPLAVPILTPPPPDQCFAIIPYDSSYKTELLATTQNNADLMGCDPRVDSPLHILPGGIYQVRDHYFDPTGLPAPFNQLQNVGLRIGALWMSFSQTFASSDYSLEEDSVVKFIYEPGHNRSTLEGTGLCMMRVGSGVPSHVSTHGLPQQCKIQLNIAGGIMPFTGGATTAGVFSVNAIHGLQSGTISFFDGSLPVHFTMADIDGQMVPPNVLSDLAPFLPADNTVGMVMGVDLPGVFPGIYTGIAAVQVDCGEVFACGFGSNAVWKAAACYPFFSPSCPGLGLLSFDVESVCNDCEPATPTPGICPVHGSHSHSHSHQQSHSDSNMHVRGRREGAAQASIKLQNAGVERAADGTDPKAPPAAPPAPPAAAVEGATGADQAVVGEAVSKAAIGEANTQMRSWVPIAIFGILLAVVMLFMAFVETAGRESPSARVRDRRKVTIPAEINDVNDGAGIPSSAVAAARKIKEHQSDAAKGEMSDAGYSSWEDGDARPASLHAVDTVRGILENAPAPPPQDSDDGF